MPKWAKAFIVVPLTVIAVSVLWFLEKSAGIFSIVFGKEEDDE